MNDPHLDPDLIERIADGELDDPHAAACALCAARVEEARALWRALQSLPAAATVPASVWRGVRDGMHGKRRLPRWAAAAAAMVLFAAGFAAGRWSPREEVPQSRSRGEAREIQRTGTEYVAAIAEFAADDPFARDQARDATAAAIYGAATALTTLAPDDGRAAEVMRAAETLMAPRSSRPVRF
jgi:hypothetical protein